MLEPLIKALGSPSSAVRVAACKCSLSLSRSVRHLCVTLVDGNLAAHLLRLLSDADPHVQVRESLSFSLGLSARVPTFGGSSERELKG